MKNYAIKLTKINRILDQENVTWIFETNLDQGCQELKDNLCTSIIKNSL